jgi:hypothetical protein
MAADVPFPGRSRGGTLADIQAGPQIEVGTAHDRSVWQKEKICDYGRFSSRHSIVCNPWLEPMGDRVCLEGRASR